MQMTFCSALAIITYALACHLHSLWKQAALLNDSEALLQGEGAVLSLLIWKTSQYQASLEKTWAELNFSLHLKSY